MIIVKPAQIESNLSKYKIDSDCLLEGNIPLKSDNKIFPAGLSPCFDTFPGMQHCICKIDKFVQSRDNFGGQSGIVFNHLDRAKHEGVPEMPKSGQKVGWFDE